MSESSTASGDQTSHSMADAVLPADTDRKLQWGAVSIAVAGLMFVGYGLTFLYRAFYGDGFELGVHTLGDVTRAELAATNPELLYYIDHLHVNIAGLMIPVGIAMVVLAWYGVRRGQWWAYTTALVLPIVFLAFSLPMHFTGGFSYHALTHIGPAGVGGPILLVGAVLAYQGLQSLDRTQ